ncbi:nucleoside triphosphate pyrophosphohydrolase [Nonlabens spongiae]|uniref:Nucleoside triphosphate pyrophosphohydrolase n=1 Tax=Nonlabens spongiae TaxID=331648 RepID=A0A1W6MJ61_9FLAO|nr:nucleoside triphosphate pyrophosphohydrolase [Nonlabens spongiae]ARN77622.1 nucleoside triphosphate pyrophosphohydrolase [Nonlabens spongiae]
MSAREEQLAAFNRLLDIMDELREKCPWDRKQTLESLRHLTIEETYELGDAILEGDKKEIANELGDLLLHIVFYSKIGSETGDFDMASVAHGICEKLIHRHPHIYGDVEVANEEDVKANWEAIKLKEGKGKKGVLDGVPASLPALVKSKRIQDKVAGVGFDWERPEQVKEKLEEELQELEEEVLRGNKDAMEAEYGDVLFSLVNYGKHLGLNAEDALERTNKKFIKRFSYLENAVKKSGNTINELSLEELDVYWNEAKKL